MGENNRNYESLIERAFLDRAIPYSEESIRKLAGYMDGILSWNEKVNLTAITDPEEFVEKHYIDSLSIIDFPEYVEADTVLDLGTGGGFPGVPLAIQSPEKRFILVDSLAKRLKIIDELAKGLGIENIETVHGRAEDLGRDPEYREKLPLLVSRAVADMAVLSEYSLPLVSVGGSFAAYKSENIREELEGSEKAISLLGGKTEKCVRTDENRQIVIVKKIKSTPPKFPRKAGTPKKEPL